MPHARRSYWFPVAGLNNTQLKSFRQITSIQKVLYRLCPVLLSYKEKKWGLFSRIFYSVYSNKSGLISDILLDLLIFHFFSRNEKSEFFIRPFAIYFCVCGWHLQYPIILVIFFSQTFKLWLLFRQNCLRRLFWWEKDWNDNCNNHWRRFSARKHFPGRLLVLHEE